MNEIRGKNVCIFGYGREGSSALGFIRQHYPECSLSVAEQNEQNPLLASIPAEVRVYSGRQHQEALAQADTIIRSPGIPLHHPALKEAQSRGTRLSSATNLFFAHCPGITFGVTGTKGKSTTSSLLAHLLEAKYKDVRLVGNIGNPALDALKNANSTTVFVVECSSFQLDDFHHAPHCSVHLGIVEEHIDYHRSFDLYARAKANLSRQQLASDFLCYNSKQEMLKELTAESKARRIHFGTSDDSVRFIDDMLHIGADSTHTLPVEALVLRGKGNRENILAACSVALAFGVPPEEIARQLLSFKGLPHRLEQVAEVAGISFYDDSLSTIPESCIQALDGLGAKVHTLIAGGHDRGRSYELLADALLESSVRTLITLPDTGALIWEACQTVGNKSLRHIPVANMPDAVAAAFAHTPADRICLLSPASSSLNLFRDYRDRAAQYLAAIQAHPACAQQRAPQSTEKKTQAV